MNSASTGIDQALGRVVELVTARLEAGETLDVEAVAREYPDHAAELRELFPTLVALAGLEHQAAGEPLRELGDFRILGVLGLGGMGVVYEAEQLSLGRKVALKVLPFAGAMDPRQLQRFQNEARAAACLHHPNIVPVYAFGCERGVHYYAMQLVDGCNLAEQIRALRQRRHELDLPDPDGRTVAYGGSTDDGPQVDNALAEAFATDPALYSLEFFRTAAAWGAAAAEALHHAHQVGIVHRDVKPANLLLDWSGQVWVTDFGLAHLPSEGELTLSGDVLGTLRYMSPEQAAGLRAVIDERTDVYSLGVTLYELLSLRPAFRGEDRAEILRQIAFDEPKSPRSVDRTIPIELETIVLKAMAKEPSERYATAQDLADDLLAWLDDRPIAARRPTVAQRLTKWTRRHRGLVLTSVVALLLAVAGLAASTVLIALEQGRTKTESQAKDRALFVAQVARTAAERETETSQQLLYRTRMGMASETWLRSDVQGARELLAQYAPTAGLPDRRGWEWHYLNGLLRGELLNLGGADGGEPGPGVFSAAWSPDGSRIATVGGAWVPPNDVQVKQPGRVQVWDAATGRRLLDLKGHPWLALSVAWSADGRRLASGCVHGEVKVWDAATGEQTRALPRQEDAGIIRLAWSPVGNYLAAWGNDILVWDADTGEEVFRTTKPKDVLYAPHLCWSPDGRLLATSTGGNDAATHPITIWDVYEKTERVTLAGHENSDGAYALAWSPDATCRASAGWDRAVRLWDVATGEQLNSLPIGKMEAMPIGTLLAWSPDGKRLAALDAGSSVSVWEDPLNRAFPRILEGHQKQVTALCWSPDGRLATSSHDASVRVWDAQGRCLATLRGHRVSASVSGWSRDGRRLASVGHSEGVKVWDTDAPVEVAYLEGHTNKVLSVCWSPDGKRLASADDDDTVRVWDAATRRHLYSLTGGCSASVYHACSWSGDGRFFAAPAKEGKVQVWDLSNPEMARPWPGYAGAVRAVAWDPTGQRLATASSDGMVRIWDWVSGRTRQHLGHGTDVLAVAWSPDGKRLASLGHRSLEKANQVIIWDGTTGIRLVELPEADQNNRLLAWSSDGTQVAYRGVDKSIHVADAASGRDVFVLRGPQEPTCATWSRDGRRLASGDAAGAVTIWDLEAKHDILTLPTHRGKIVALAWSPDGKCLATAGEDGTVGLRRAWWDEDRAERLAVANARLAWSLASRVDEPFPATTRAVNLARSIADKAGPTGSWARVILGVANYRAGEADAAVAALEWGIARDFVDGSEGFFLARALWARGDKDRAREAFHNAAAWMDGNKVGDQELLRFRSDAATMLGVVDTPRQAPPPPKKTHSASARLIITWENPDAVIADARASLDRKPDSAECNNHLAWLLVTCPDVRCRDAVEALRLAKRAVALGPWDHELWNTLGLAHYRNGEWKEAQMAVRKSMDLKRSGTGFDLFILAMAHSRLGEKAAARNWYDKGVTWTVRNLPDDDELGRLRAEAAEVLGVTKPGSAGK